MDLDHLRRKENNDIIDHVEAIREIISRKCTRCNGFECMGCIFFPILPDESTDFSSLRNGDSIPSLLNMVLELMKNVPNDRLAKQRYSKEHNAFWQKNIRKMIMKNKPLCEIFQQAFDTGDIGTLRALRLEIIDETIRFAQTGSYKVSNKTIQLPNAEQMMSGSVLYTNLERIETPPSENKTIVEVLDSDSLLAGKKMVDEGYNPAVLNFANRRTPGGGVLRGAGTQEENIFRRSNLSLSLYQFHWHGKQFNIPQKEEHYPLDRNTGGVYSPHVTVFRGLELDGYPLLEQPYQVGVVTVAALNRPALKDPKHLADDMVPPALRKIRTIFRIAIQHGHDALVLGAWGCGAFKNPPEHIARLFHEVMNEEEFRNHFKKIVFAVVDRKGIDKTAFKEGNLEAFQAEFGGKHVGP